MAARKVAIVESDSDFGRTRLIYLVSESALPSAPDFAPADQLGAVDDAPPWHRGELRVYLNTFTSESALTRDEWASLVATVDAIFASLPDEPRAPEAPRTLRDRVLDLMAEASEEEKRALIVRLREGLPQPTAPSEPAPNTALGRRVGIERP